MGDMLFPRFFSIAFLCLTLASLVYADFGPTAAEEEVIVNCLLRVKHERPSSYCRKVTRLARSMPEREKHNRCSLKKATGDATYDSHVNDAAKDYMCALNDFQNTGGARGDVWRAVSSMATCARLRKSMWKSWQCFLNKRRYGTILLTPARQERNGTTITAFFDATGNDGAGHKPEDVEAADIVISRSSDEGVELFGRYAITASSQLSNDTVRLQKTFPIHESSQATCPCNRQRYFVGGLNEFGLRDVSNYFTSGEMLMTLNVDAIPQRQITKAPNGTNVEANIDVVEGLSAIVLHVRQKENNLDGLLGADIDPLLRPHVERVRRDLARPERQPRSPVSRATVNDNCHRVQYNRKFTDNELILRPESFDLGECDGSCDDIMSIDALNATNHAITMKTEERSEKRNSQNPEPTVCCVPISYRTFHYITLDNRGNIRGEYVENMVTNYCGCR